MVGVIGSVVIAPPRATVPLEAALEAEAEPASFKAEAEPTAVEPEAESAVTATVVVTSFALKSASATAASRIVTVMRETDVAADKREDGQSKGRPGNAFHDMAPVDVVG